MRQQRLMRQQGQAGPTVNRHEPSTGRNPTKAAIRAPRDGISIIVDIYLAENEVAVHNHRSSRAGRISSHVSPSR
jgi:hypothetical protein